MQHLIDNFPPGELLHIVSVANKHRLMTTEDKRYLIALRMSAPYSDGTYCIEDSKKEEFPRVFEDFLTGLSADAHCGEDGCSICNRFHVLKSHAEAARAQGFQEAKLSQEAHASQEAELSQEAHVSQEAKLSQEAHASQDGGAGETDSVMSSYTMEPDEDELARPEDISISQARTKMALKRREERLAKARERMNQEGRNRKKVKVKMKRSDVSREEAAYSQAEAASSPDHRTGTSVQSKDSMHSDLNSSHDTLETSLQLRLKEAAAVDVESLSARKLLEYAEECRRLMSLAAEHLESQDGAGKSNYSPEDESDWLENRRMYASA